MQSWTLANAQEPNGLRQMNILGSGRVKHLWNNVDNHKDLCMLVPPLSSSSSSNSLINK